MEVPPVKLEKPNRLEIYASYCEQIDGIKYIDNEQTSDRIVTSQIMLGTFAIMGIALFSHIHIGHIAPLLLAILIPLVSTIWITTKFIADLGVKERLRLAFFSEAKRLEEKHDWLPRFHCKIVADDIYYRIGSSHKRSSYYFAIVGCLLASSVAQVFIYSPFNKLWHWINLIVMSACYLLYFWILSKIALSSNLILEQMEKLGE
jgi:hypothetical protein